MNVFKLGICVFASSSLLWATPDRVVEVTERVIGANREHYAVLRTEVDNHGSYYISQKKQYLDVYEKKAEDPSPLVGALLTKLADSVLLLDVTSTYDAGMDYADPGAHSEKVESRNVNISMADLLLRYPHLPTALDKRVEDGVVAKSRVDVPALGFIWGGWVKEKLSHDRNSNIKWRRDGITQDMNCFYMSVSYEHEQRIVCIPPKVVEMTYERLDLEPVCIVAGKFETKDEAFEMVKAIGERGKVKVNNKFTPEVWYEHQRTDKILYVVMVKNSGRIFKRGSFLELKEDFGIDFSVESSGRFQYKVEEE